MALTTKRIIALPSQTDPQEGDYLAIDNMQNGTHKIPVGRIGVEVDDTLTEQGEAADAKAVGDALDEIRSQVEATDDAIDEIRSQIEVTGTASGAIATFTDGSDMPAKSVIVNIEPKQSGTGTPSPENVRPISGWESVNVYKSGKNKLQVTATSLTTQGVTFTVDDNGVIHTSGTATSNIDFYCGTYTSKGGTYSANGCASGGETDSTYWMFFGYMGADSGQGVNNKTIASGNRITARIYFKSGTNANNLTFKPMIRLASDTDPTYAPYTGTTTTVNLGRTVYGGTLDVVSGSLTAYPFYPSYNGETLDGRWICDRAVYTEGTTPPTGSQVALISGTGTTYQLTPTEIQTLLGENNVWADAGAVEVVYVRDLNIAINNLLNSNGTRSLGMMAMSAPTKDTAEEPTDEQTEEPAEDDMR